MAPRAKPVVVVRAWMRAHPTLADGILAAALAVGGIVGLFVGGPAAEHEGVGALAVVLVLVQTVPITWRRRTPASVVAVTTTGLVLSDLLGDPNTLASLSLLIAIYSVAAYARRERAIWTAALLAVAMAIWAVTAWLVGQTEIGADDIVGNLIAFAAAFLLGDVVRRRRERVAELEERARRLEHERKLETDRAAQRERVRIARELHDVVAHSVTVMVVQASAGRRVAATDPERAVEALGAIEQTGREALDELRRLLGVLRRDVGTETAAPVAELAPQPSLAQVAELAAADPSLTVSLAVEGTPVPVSSSVEVSAYRIVQEALTNVRKHAGPARASVVLRYGQDRLEVEIVDDGRGAGAVHGPPGHGLAGMRERATLCGGELRAGPHRGGGWQVRANLPYHSARVGAA